MNPTDPRYIRAQYESGNPLAIISETHRRCGVAREDVFHAVTRTLIERGHHPMEILDIGAGTGNWYRAIRELAGAHPYYSGLDQSPGMAEALAKRFGEDPNARAVVGDASSLGFLDETFDWVGMHFVIYFLSDMQAGLLEAWRTVRSGGVLVCATNGRRPHYELWDLQEEAARRLGLPGAADAVTASDRFNLDNGARYFPAPPLVFRWPAGFRFDDADAVIRYLNAGPIRKHLGTQADDPAVRGAALEWIRAEVNRIITQYGIFTVRSEVGFFLLQRD